MLKRFLFSLLVLLPFISKAQSPMFIDSVRKNSTWPDLKEYAVTYLPENYTSAKKYPLILFFHGAGESGTSKADLAKIYNNSSAGGPAYLITHGQWPDSFYNYRDGKYYQPIVIAPQAGGGWSTDYKVVSVLIQELLTRYSIDTTRIYLTGLSAGGWTVWNYSAHYQQTPLYPAAAIVPMSMATNATQTDAQYIVADSVRNWGFGDVAGDSWGLQTSNGVDYMNAIVPGIARFTYTHGTGHGGWAHNYSTSTRETIDGHSVNIYEWMLWWKRPSTNEGGDPGNQPPTVDAGSDKFLSSGTTSTTLTAVGNDIDGSVVSYQWAKLSGPSVTISNSSNSTCTVSGLSDNNTYVFRVVVTDNDGLTAFDDVSVSVDNDNPPVVNAGENITIYQPENSVSLSGSATDDGTISSHEWSIISKPSGSDPSITSSTSYNTTVTALTVVGSYTFRLTATDDASQSSHDDITVFVNEQPQEGNSAKFQFGPYGATKVEGYAYLLGNPSGKILSASQNGITVNTISTAQWIGLGGDTSRGSKSQGKITGDDSGIRPDNILKYYALNDGSYWGRNINGTVQSYNLQVSGLVPFGFYNLKMGSSVDDAQVGTYETGDVEYRVGSNIQTLDITNNTTDESVFSNVQSDGNGNLFLSVRPLQGGGSNGKSSMGHISWLEVISLDASNLPPVAIAGNDTTIANDQTTFTLDGTGSYDPDGTISSYHWYKAAGDTGNITLSNATSSEATVSGIDEDTSYTFKLVVTDDRGSSDSDYISIVVGSPIVGDPVVSAGYPQLLPQGTSLYTLNGSVTVAGGEISSHTWSQVLGPSVSISDPSALSTAVSGLSDGEIYRFRLKATNNVGVSDSQDVVIAVNKYYSNKRDTIITTTLTNYHLVNIDFDQTPYNKDTISILGGEYTYLFLKNLKGTSSKRVIIRPLGGPVQFTSHVTGGTAGMLFSNCQYFHVDGEMSDTTYGFNLIGAERWGQINISGQSKCFEINNVYGHWMTYGFQIKNDPNCDPISWNDDEASTFVMDSIDLHHFYFDSTIYEGTYIGGTLNTSKTSYPPHGGYRVACSGDTTYTFGYRIGHIKIHDGTIKHTENDGIQLVDVRYGKTEIYNMNIQDLGANGGGWQDHAMSIGGFQHVEVHDNYIHNAGFGIFMNGIESASIYNNTIINVPNGPGMFIASAKDTLYQKLTADSQLVRIYDNNIDEVQYGIQLTNYGSVLSTKSQVYNNTITNASIASFDHVNDPNVIWQGDYGGSTLDTSHGTNPFVVINSVDTSGNTIIIHASTNSDLGIQYSLDGTTWLTDSVFTGLSQGWYIASARISPEMRDNRNLVYVSASSHTNVPPKAILGDSLTYPYYTTTINLLGQGSDVDGTIVSWSWVKLSGDGGAITSPSTQNTPFTGLQTGELYSIELTVTDDSGAVGKDTMKIKILENVPPTVSAGSDQTLPYTTSSTVLSSSAVDTDGEISSYLWTQVSGKNATIESPTNQSTLISNLSPGETYTFKVTAYDNGGANSSDEINITVDQIPSSERPKALLYIINNKIVIVNL